MLSGTHSPPRLLLILVAFHPSRDEVSRLSACLDALPPDVAYVVVANDYTEPEPIDGLRAQAHLFLTLKSNHGYGAAFNYALAQLTEIPEYLGALNTDLEWKEGTFELMIQWLDCHQDVCLATPMITDEYSIVQHLCKRNPTILALLSRRFWPEPLKPQWLRRYDRWFVMLEQDYSRVFDVSYLSGCCMVMRSRVLAKCGGFDESYFLYLEDADLTRSMSGYGRCVHLPLAQVVHRWGRGSYRNLHLALVNIQSAWIYFKKWGLRWY